MRWGILFFVVTICLAWQVGCDNSEDKKSVCERYCEHEMNDCEDWDHWVSMESCLHSCNLEVTTAYEINEECGQTMIAIYICKIDLSCEDLDLSAWASCPYEWDRMNQACQ